jgi:hypothetical protein
VVFMEPLAVGTHGPLAVGTHEPLAIGTHGPLAVSFHGPLGIGIHGANGCMYSWSHWLFVLVELLAVGSCGKPGCR